MLPLCLVLAISVGATSERDAQPTEPWDLAQLMTAMAGVKETRDTFTESKAMAVLTAPLELSGTLAYMRPNHIEKHVRTPYEEHLVVEGEMLTLTNKDGQKRIALRKYPMIRAFVESIRATLAGDAGALRRFYHVTLAGERRQWVLTLKPLEPQLAEYVRFIKVAGMENRLTRIDIQEAGGDSSVMMIQGDQS
jgi:outer membrane lipoprotein-sorting protein